MSKLPLIVTHNGTFHGDDVCAVAILSLILDDKFELVRTREESYFAKADYLVDVGVQNDAATNRFDHHQLGGAGVRQNGVPYAACGLVWRKFGENLAGSSEAAELIDRKLIQYIDATDNGLDTFKPISSDLSVYVFQKAIDSFLPTWVDLPDPENQRFLSAVSYAKEILRNEIRWAKADLAGRDVVAKAYERAQDNKIIELPTMHYPWKTFLVDKPEVFYVIEKYSDRDHWRVEAVPESLGSFAVRRPFPETWAGRRDEELAKITGVSDAVFCHNGRFMVVAKTKEGAIKLARLALES